MTSSPRAPEAPRTPAPLTPAQDAALARLRYGIEGAAGIVLLAGAAGVGKTLVLGAFAAELASHGVSHAFVASAAQAAEGACHPDRPRVLLADDAHGWSAAEIAAVAAASRSGALVFAGRGRLLTLVSRDERVASRVRLRAVVPPFTLDDTRRLVAARLGDTALADPGAVRTLHEIAAAIPARLVRLLDLTAVVAAGGRRLTAADVEAIHARLDPDAG